MKQYTFLYIIAAAVIFTACKNKDFLYQDISSRIWLGKRVTVGASVGIVDSSVSSFMRLPAEADTDTLYVTANLTGMAAATDRPFTLSVIPELTNVSAADYSIEQPVMPANSFIAQIPVVVHKQVAGLDLRKQQAKVTFRFIPNQYFLNGTPGRDTFRIVWVNFLTMPPEWPLLQSYIGPFSQARYKFILDFYGEIDFEKFRTNSNLSLGLQSALKKLLRDYNNNPNNAGRPEGWPYLNDNGTPLTF